MLNRLKELFLGSDAAIAATSVDSQHYLRWGGKILLTAFAVFLAWAAFAPLDSGVAAPATVKVAGNRKTIQHLTGGVVDQILVKEGEPVKRNQVLIKLNPTRTRSDLGVTHAQFIVAKTVESRLLAERDNLVAIQFSPELKPFAQDPRLKDAMVLQERLFTTRRAALQGELAILKENLAGAKEQLAGLEEVRKTRAVQLKSISEELASVRELAKDGYFPRNRMLEVERSAASLNGQLAEDIANIGKIKNQIGEFKLRGIYRQQEYQKEVQQQLTDIQKETTALASRLDAINYEVDNTLIRSPIDGYVVGLMVHTVGGVIQPGGHLMDIIPEHETFLVDAQVPVESIDKVHANLPVDIAFPALSSKQTPNIPGEVLTISADRLTDEVTRQPYFLAQVKVSSDGMKMLGQHKIRPGMAASVTIKTGERTMLNYLFKPLFDRIASGFKEE